MSRSRNITVNFFHIQPLPADESSYSRLAALIGSIDPNTLTDKPKKLDYELCSHVVELRDGFLTGALSNGQTGGLLPYRHNRSGDMMPVLEPGEKLIHPTCFVYDVERSVLLLESIAKGATEADWCFYFHNNLLKAPSLRAQVVEKGELDDLVENLQYITQLDVEVAGFRRDDLFSGLSKKRGVREMAAIAEASHSNTVHCVLKTEIKRKNKHNQRPDQESLEPGFVRRVINNFRQAPEVKKLSLSGINNDNDYVPLINLMEFRLRDSIEVDISELTMANLNLKKRVERLKIVHEKHVANLIRFDKNVTS